MARPSSIREAPVISSLGRLPNDLLLSDALNATLLDYGMVCLRLTPPVSTTPLPKQQVADIAVMWEKLDGLFLPADHPCIKGGPRLPRGESPLADFHRLTIKPPKTSSPADVRKDAWSLVGVEHPPAQATTACNKKAKTEKNNNNGRKSSRTAPAGSVDLVKDGPSSHRTAGGRFGPGMPGKAGQLGWGYLDYSAILLLSPPIPLMSHAEQPFMYLSLAQREHLFWNFPGPLQSLTLSDVPMPPELDTGTPWSLYRIGEATDLHDILNQLCQSQWARDHPDSLVWPPYYGTLRPVMYQSAAMSFFTMHIEDYALPSLNWLLDATHTSSHLPPSRGGMHLEDDEREAGEEGGVVWYACPVSAFGALHDYAAAHMDPALRQPELLATPFTLDWWLFDPVDLQAAGIPVTRFVQRPGDIIVTGPGAMHWGINLTTAVKVREEFLASLHLISAAHDRGPGCRQLGISEALVPGREGSPPYHARAAERSGCQATQEGAV